MLLVTMTTREGSSNQVVRRTCRSCNDWMVGSCLVALALALAPAWFAGRGAGQLPSFGGATVVTRQDGGGSHSGLDERGT